MRTRDGNLDLLRASAILMVLVAHVTPRLPGAPAPLLACTRYGVYGVDLFFVLSGWLIGGLLWREQVKFGDVEIGRFISRRALRTMPPYFVALGICYLAVYLLKSHQPFDWGYLFFLQNYYHRMPFFLISWSLCVEEHFYLVMPFVAVALTRFSIRPYFFLIFAVVPPLCRAFTALPGPTAFGFPSTATHLHFEGLLFGVWASFLRYRHPLAWERLRRFAAVALLPALLLVVAVEFLPERPNYTLSGTVIAVLMALVLVTVVERRAFFFSDSKAVFWIASTSYSVYLTHSFALDAATRLAARMPQGVTLQLPIIAGLIAVMGVAFYRCVEIPSLVTRHRWMPARSGDRSPLLGA